MADINSTSSNTGATSAHSATQANTDQAKLLKVIDTANTDNAIVNIEAARSLLKCIYFQLLSEPDHNLVFRSEDLGCALAGIESILSQASESLHA